jgi:MOSC domain-containing protein YiiM
MKLLSVNVGLPREVKWDGRMIRTSIFKTPVAGRVVVGKINLNGDQQSDLTVHAGELAAGDPIELMAHDENRVTVADIVELYHTDAAKQDFLHSVSELAALPDNWRAYFRKRLRMLSA